VKSLYVSSVVALGRQTTKLQEFTFNAAFSHKFSIVPSESGSKILTGCTSGTDLSITISNVVKTVRHMPAHDKKRDVCLFVMLGFVCTVNAIKQCNFQNNFDALVFIGECS